MESNNNHKLVESNDSCDQSDIYAIRSRSEQEDLKEKLKPSLLGGYAKKDVDRFIEEMKEREKQMKLNLQQQIKDLLAERSSLSHECSLLKSQLCEAEKSGVNFDKVQEQLQQCNKDNKNLQMALEQKQQEYQSLETSYQEMTEKYNQSCEQIGSIDPEETTNLKQRLEELKVYCTDLEQDAVNKKKEKENLLAEIQQLKNDKLEDSEEDLSDYKSKLRLEQEKYSSLEQSFQRKNSELSDALERLTQFESAITQKDQLLSLNKEKRKKEAERAKKHFQNWIRKMQDQQSKIDSLQNEVQSTQNVRDKVEQLQKEYSNLHENYAHSEKIINTLQNQKKDMQTMLSKYQEEEKENISLKRMIDCYRREIRSIQSSVQDILDQMGVQAESAKKLFQESENRKEQLNQLLQDKTALQVQNVKLLDRLNESNENNGKLEQEILQLSSQLEAYQGDVADFTESKREDHHAENQHDGDGGNLLRPENITFPFQQAQQKAKELAEWNLLKKDQNN